jgi:hypothetical protein
MIDNVLVKWSVKYCYCCHILMNLEFSRQVFERKNFKYQISRKFVQWNRVVPCRLTDRHDEANSYSSQFCERAPKTVTFLAIVTIELGIEGTHNPHCCYITTELQMTANTLHQP